MRPQLGQLRHEPRLLAVVVLIVVGALVWWASATAPPAVKATVAHAEQVPIEQATLVCPQAGGDPRDGTAAISYADGDLTGLANGGDAASTLTAGPLDPLGVATPVVPQPGHAWAVDGPATLGPVQLNVTGDLATDLSAVQFSQTSVAGALQAAAVPCEGPTTDAWFAGFSSAVGAHTALLLSNVDTVPATVDVTIWSDQANAEPTLRRGIKVDPQTQTVVQLDQIDPGVDNGVVHVVATVGRVAPAVRYDAENGSIPLGVDWLPRTAAPATTATVPGYTGGPGTRRLLVADPGDIDATYSVEVVTPDGSFTPTEFATLTVTAGTVASIDLATVLQEEAAAVVVTSSDPVVVGGINTLAPDATGATDVSFVAAVPALSGPSLMAGGEVSAVAHTQLLLSAPDADADVTVTLLPSASASSPLVSPLTVPGGTTMVLDLGAIGSDPAPAVQVTPDGGGPLYAAWLVHERGTDTSDLTGLPLRTPIRSLSRPPVYFSPLAGLPSLRPPAALVTPSAPASSAPVSSPPAESSGPDSFPPESSGPPDSEAPESGASEPGASEPPGSAPASSGGP